jgi:hypothetical protein
MLSWATVAIMCKSSSSRLKWRIRQEFCCIIRKFFQRLQHTMAYRVLLCSEIPPKSQPCTRHNFLRYFLFDSTLLLTVESYLETIGMCKKKARTHTHLHSQTLPDNIFDLFLLIIWWMWYINLFQFPVLSQRVYWLAEWLLTSQEGLWSMELVVLSNELW